MSRSGDFLTNEPTQAPVEEGAPLWTVTFGDMMSLLLTFFILLFSMSELKMERFLLASQSLSSALGGTAPEEVTDPQGLVPDPGDEGARSQTSEDSVSVGSVTRSEEDSTAVIGADQGSRPGVESVAERLTDEYLAQLADLLEEFVREHRLEETLLVIRGPTGVRLRIMASALFQPGVGVVDEDSRWILESVADITAGIRIPVVVSGHADNQPIANERFASNWELSAVRAAGVARELVGRGGDPSLVRVESYGEHRPIAGNDSEEGRAQNRRVEFVYDRKDVLATIERWRADLSRQPARP